MLASATEVHRLHVLDLRRSNTISAQTPLAFLIALIYLLGALTGGSLLALLRESIAGAKLSGSMPS